VSGFVKLHKFAFQTKFMKDVRGLLEFPHTFTHGQKKIFYVFSEVLFCLTFSKAI